MPEGDTIHRIAAALEPRLVGKILERVTTQGLARDVAGDRVTRVHAHGKHLVIDLEGGASVRVHLGMVGRQRSYDRDAGEAVLARMSPGRVSLALVTDEGVHLWIGARTIEIAHRRAPQRGLAIARLGPDVLADGFDAAAAAARAAVHGSHTIGDVLLDQRVAAGLGNIYKCEALFLRGIDPRTRVSALSPAILEALYTTARVLMRANLGPHARATRDRLAGDPPDDTRYFVYSRSGKPCRRCGAPIACARLGDPPRWTWWCPACQPGGAPGGVNS